MSALDKKKYFWLKLPKDFFKKFDIRLLKSSPNGHKLLIIYLELLCESTSHEGKLRYSDTKPYTEEMLATVLEEDIKVVSTAIKKLTELELMELQEDGTYYLKEVKNMYGQESGKARRMRNYRGSNEPSVGSNEPNVSPNEPNVSPNEPDVGSNEPKCSLETEIELEKELELEKDIYITTTKEKENNVVVELPSISEYKSRLIESGVTSEDITKIDEIYDSVVSNLDNQEKKKIVDNIKKFNLTGFYDLCGIIKDSTNISNKIGYALGAAKRKVAELC